MFPPPPPPEIVTIQLPADQLTSLARLLDQSRVVQRSATPRQRQLHPVYDAAETICNAADELINASRAYRYHQAKERRRETPPEVSP